MCIEQRLEQLDVPRVGNPTTRAAGQSLGVRAGIDDVARWPEVAGMTES